MKKLFILPSFLIVSLTAFNQNIFRYPVIDSNDVTIAASTYGNLARSPIMNFRNNYGRYFQNFRWSSTDHSVIWDSTTFFQIGTTQFLVADYVGNNGLNLDFQGGQYLIGDESGAFNGSYLSIDANGALGSFNACDVVPTVTATQNLGSAAAHWDTGFIDHLICDDCVYTDKTTLSSAQILDLFDTPVELVPAPGAGKMIQVLSVYGKMNFLTAAYATNTALRVYSATSSDNIYSESAILLPASSTTRATFDVDGSAVVLANSPLMVTVFGGDPTDGGGSLDIYCTYKIITE